MTAVKLFETTNIPGHLAPTVERLERLISKQSLEELYEVEEEAFARGKYAMVKRCRERSSGTQWAAKFLKKRRRAEEFKAEVLHEMAVLDAAAPCSRLVSLHQVFETNTDMILVLELATGGELQLILDRDEVPEERQVARLLKQIMEGIVFLHSLNIAHLDLKPQNLVLTGEYPNCDVKLCDFGISRHIGQGVDIREILGTPDYVAPEVLNYEPISLATDMWSVGVLLYVLLTGCSPFGGDTNQETFCNISRCHLDFPDDLFEDISEDACDLIRKLIVKDPKGRLTATECLQHPWFSLFEQPSKSVTSVTCSTDDDNCVAADSQKEDTLSQLPSMLDGTIESTMMSSSTPLKSDNEKQQLSTIEPGHGSDSCTKSMGSLSVVSSHTENLSVIKLPPRQLRVGLNPDRMDTFKKNMDSLVRKFTPQIVLVDSSSTTAPTTTITTTTTTSSSVQQRRATAVHTMPARGEVFKCTPVFILGEAQHRHQCSDNSSDTISEISIDSASDRSSIYSDSDSLDFILCNKSQTRVSFPFTTADTTVDRWHRTRVWPRECSDVVSKALSRLTSEGSPMTTNIPTSSTTLCTNKTELKVSLGEHGGNLVVIREPVRTGKYTMYSEVQCESLKARIQRLQVSKSSS